MGRWPRCCLPTPLAPWPWLWPQGGGRGPPSWDERRGDGSTQRLSAEGGAGEYARGSNYGGVLICLSSTYCILVYKALQAGSTGRACLPGIYSTWPVPLSSNCQTGPHWDLEMAAAGGSGPLGMPWSGRLTPPSPSADVSPT